MEKELKSKEAKGLWDAILQLESVSECEKFFRDLCTFNEIQDMTERFDVACRVDKGESYREINQNTGISTATITRVAHWLNHGMNGYRLIIDKMKKKQSK